MTPDAAEPAPPGTRAAVLRVKEIGSAHVGGRSVSLHGLPAREIVFSPGNPPVTIDPNGDFEIEQMYVQYVRLESPRARHPLLLVHGGGLCGVSYETKPDGSPGWQDWFLRAGHDVYVADAVERGRASWARSPEFFRGEPVFRSKAEAWELFRIGPDGSWHTAAGQRQAHADGRFPVAAFDQFMKQSIPRWSSNDSAIQAAYGELARRYGPFVVVAHSQGCNFAFAMALAHPGMVKAVVAVEPSGFPEPSRQVLAQIRHIPHLFVWGDHIDTSATWVRVRQGLDAYRGALRDAGVVVDELDLPALGIRGNSHMLMMDTNSDQVAALVNGWMAKQALTTA